MTTVDLDLIAAAMGRATDPADVEALMLLLRPELEQSWRAWLGHLFPGYVTAGYAPHHEDFWEWGWSIQPGEHHQPFVAIWPRGGAKSTSVELLVAALGARRRRRYVLYVCDKQAQAEDHVGNIGALLESDRVADLYPELGQRLVNAYGQSRGWRRERLRSAGGFTVDAIGLDSAARGAKLDEDRPDLIVFDDIDDGTDSPKVTQRKIDQLTRTFLPALVQHGGTVLAVQNLVLRDGVFARIAGMGEQAADFLQDRQISGPLPAVRGLEIGKDDEGRDVYLSGEPVWAGQGPEQINAQIQLWGPTAFRIEAQHQVELRSGGRFHAWDWMTGRWVQDNMPEHAFRCRAWDQAGTEFDGKNDPDWTVGVRWAFDPTENLYRIEDIVRFRHSAGRRDEIMRATAAADAERFGLDTVAQLIEQRPGDLGRDEADRIVREVFQGHLAHKIPPIGSKPERADGLAGAMENELVTIVEQDPDPDHYQSGTRTFLAECEGFPLGDHDDQVDAAAHGFNWLRKDVQHSGGISSAAGAAAGRLRR